MLNTFQKGIFRARAEIPYYMQRLKHAKKLPALNLQDQQIVDICCREGVCMTTLEHLGFASTTQLLESARQCVDKLQTNFSVDYTDRQYAGSSNAPVYPHTLTVTYLPEFANWGREPRLLNTVENYIGLPIAFQGVQLQRDFSNERQVFTELWHRDAEDRRMIKVIVYLSDVEEEHGPFQYIPKSKVSPLLSRRIQSNIAKSNELGITDAAMDKLIPRSEWRSCTGPAGTVVFVDTKAVFHHGKPRSKERSALFFVYTSADPLHPDYCAVYNDSSFIEPGFAKPLS